MIYYFHTKRENCPYIRIRSHSMYMEINVSEWFPNTKAKLNLLLKLMDEYDHRWDTPDSDDEVKWHLPEILIALQEDLKDKNTFAHRPVKSVKMFCKMLNSNIEQIRIFGGKL